MKIYIRLNDPDLPRAESMNAERVAGKQYRIENIPFYAREVSLGDVVECVEEHGEQWFSRRVERSGNGTLRVFCKTGFASGPGQRIVGGLSDRGFNLEFLGSTLMAACIPIGFEDLAWLEGFLGAERSDECFHEIPDW